MKAYSILVLLLLAPATLSFAAGTAPALLRIEPGSFTMGAEPGPDVVAPGKAIRYNGPDWDEPPAHEVRLSRPFDIATSVVTMAEFALFKPEYEALIRARHLDWQPQAPATMVTWGEATAYCRWLHKRDGKPYRLPTEAEWEFAAQALDRRVQEWCLDWWAPYSAGAQTDPAGPMDGVVRVIRGETAASRTAEVEVNGVSSSIRQAARQRLTNRSGSLPGDRRPDVGFRIVQAPLPAGAYRPALPLDPVFQNVSQRRKHWAPADPDTPFFTGRIEFIHPPADPRTLPYWGRHHVPSLIGCDNGDLLATVFTAPADNSSQMAILITRLRDGSHTWDPPARFFIAPDRNITGSVLFNNGKGVLHHYNGLGNADCRDFSMLKRTSTDNGATWSAPRIVHEYPAVPASLETYTGEPRLWPHMDMVELPDRTLLLPTDVCSGNEGGSALFASRDQGESWTEQTRFGWNPAGHGLAGGTSGWIAGIHAPIATLKSGQLLAFGRSAAIEGHAPFSLSSDTGRTWTCKASPFPPILSGQRAVLERLSEGPLLLISYTDRVGSTPGVETIDAAGKPRQIHGMYATLSLDEGRTWTRPKLIPLDAANPCDATPGGYLSCVQTPDTMIHLLNSTGYYRFNLAWLRTPMPP